mmetsp:Transcript_27689/g.87805  ORF Transcript_27689/g.87805 Transcript_27689/m.87805 type:complete len:225 (-) Transcript_27689:1757-2431(-)
MAKVSSKAVTCLVRVVRIAFITRADRESGTVLMSSPSPRAVKACMRCWRRNFSGYSKLKKVCSLVAAAANPATPEMMETSNDAATRCCAKAGSLREDSKRTTFAMVIGICSMTSLTATAEIVISVIAILCSISAVASFSMRMIFARSVGFNRAPALFTGNTTCEVIEVDTLAVSAAGGTPSSSTSSAVLVASVLPRYSTSSLMRRTRRMEENTDGTSVAVRQMM